MAGDAGGGELGLAGVGVQVRAPGVERMHGAGVDGGVRVCAGLGSSCCRAGWCAAGLPSGRPWCRRSVARVGLGWSFGVRVGRGAAVVLVPGGPG